ncbi:type II CRISPR-associated endonuclease Cas1 [Novosphingobium sp.]|uniref:type II CRISPR-associated endonuclease Cas1 n=1 Tax=Novosphingobium sp. TaxID=1874826 RepID=UPI0026121634|nr:type II CRISPR-associated endonuclease Cas1 [Novosphingobium sp.]
MIHRVVELQEPGLHAHLDRGFLVVEKSREERGRVPLDDIAVLLCTGPGDSLSTNLLAALADRSICTVICGDNYHPKALVLPYDSHHLHRQRLEAQIAASVPLKKRLWQQIIRAKIAGQSSALRRCTSADSTLDVLIPRVASGDPDNIEAQAARRYWSGLFGESFTRDQARPGLNALLNYGYAILRAATARAVVAAGLYPALGLHHRSMENAFVLADDLMEPFRPLIDAHVFDHWRAHGAEVNTEAKKALARLLVADLAISDGYTILANALHTAAQSLARSLLDGFPSLELPDNLFPAVG